MRRPPAESVCVAVNRTSTRAAWDRQRLRRAGLVAAVAAGALVGAFDLAAPLDRRLVDAGFAALRGSPFGEDAPEIVIVAIDEATTKTLPDPVTLWHRHLGALLSAAAGAGARCVGLDIVLPDRSYAGIAPDLDRALIDGILRMRQKGCVVLAISSDEGGNPRSLHAPLEAAAGPDGVGYALWRLDADRVVRTFDEQLGAAGETVPTFAGQLARALGGQPRPGGINYALGGGFDILPLATVLEWARDDPPQRLAQALGGKILLVGSVLPHADRVRVPVSRWPPANDPNDEPGVIAQAQTLRTLLAGRIVQRSSPILAMALGAFAGLLWLAASTPLRAAAAVIAASGLALAAGYAGLVSDLQWPVGTVLVAAALAAGGRLALESALAWRERSWLRHAFAGYVSPQVMVELESGRLQGSSSERRRIAVMMIDMRGFTTRAEADAPERVVALLNRLYDEATAAVHGRDGTVDKFMGDGILAYFGAPASVPDACTRAFDTAVDILERVRDLSETAVAKGEGPVAAGVGMAFGEAIVGHVGTDRRHTYTAIGDCVNVAARLESLSKEAGYPVLMTAAFAAQVTGREGLTPLGMREIRGHSPLEVFGWRPP
jgi:adenylate cyclase